MRHIAFHAECPYQPLHVEILLIGVGSESCDGCILLMNLHACLCIVNEEVQVSVLDVQPGLVVDGARECDGDRWQQVNGQLGLIHIEVAPLRLEVLCPIDKEHRRAAGIIYRDMVYREPVVGCRPAYIESVHIHSHHLHPRHKREFAADGSHLQSDGQRFSGLVAAVLFAVAQHKVVHIIVAHRRIPILKQDGSVDRVVGREDNGLVAFGRRQHFSSIGDVA